jgi:virginiamycin B lyase
MEIFGFAEFDRNNIGSISPTGSIAEFPVQTATSFPCGITLGPDGNIWFTECGGNNIGRVTPAGSITEFPLSTAGGPPVTSQPK